MARKGRAFSNTSIIVERGLYAPAIIVDTDIVLLTLTPSATETFVAYLEAQQTMLKQAVNRASTY